ncbi:serine hydrolase [Pollutibacter soli]|uniref:serine hydrolase n=1 Tax=Pollutibacter soli TaxID=3034157 RepID=UPI003013B812
MQLKRITLILLVFSHLLYVHVEAQTWQDTVTLIEKAFSRYTSNIPGCQLAISRNGNLLFSKAWGMADMEHNISLTKESVTEAGSVSKQFTAACILLLEQEGKLSLDDDVRKYVPEVPDYGKTITLRHMMQHTSGLKDWGSVAGIAGWPRSTKTYNNDDAVYIISKQKTLNHPPGEEYIYSNSNYNLFAVIVERVSGKSLAEYSKRKIFEPAGMTHTEWRNDFRKIVPGRALAYAKERNVYETDMPNEYVYGNGGLLTTVEDLVKWNDYYLNGKLGDPSLLARQLTTNPLSDGSKGYYGAGLRIDSVRGWKSIAHTGATASYRASLAYYPDASLTIAWLSNSSEFDGQADVVGAVRNIFLSDKTKSAEKLTAAVYAVSEKDLQKYAGWYRNPKTGTGVKLQVNDGKLTDGNGSSLQPIAENQFNFRGGKVIMIPGNPRKINLIGNGETIVFEEVAASSNDPEILQEYIGVFYSDETESRFTVFVKDGRLILHRDPKYDQILTASYKDAFFFPGSVIVFMRDKKGKVDRLQVNVGRARNVVFEKIK